LPTTLDWVITQAVPKTYKPPPLAEPPVTVAEVAAETAPPRAWLLTTVLSVSVKGKLNWGLPP
jgi:hypothetical protein